MQLVDKTIQDLLATPVGTMKLFGSTGVAGILLLLTGMGLGKLFRSGEKFNERHLERAEEASLTKGTSMFLSNPAVTFPVALMFVGAILLIGGVVGAIVGLIRYLSA